MTREDLGESTCMHTLIYFNNNKNAIIFPVASNNRYIIISRFKNPGYYFDEQTYPHSFCRISLERPEYIRLTEDECNMKLSSEELNSFLTMLNNSYTGHIFIDTENSYYSDKDFQSGWDYILNYLSEETYDKDILNLKIPNYETLEVE